MRIIFPPADPSKRAPAWLQNGTQENIKWQFKLLAVFFALTAGRDLYNEFKWKKKYGKTPRG